MFSCLVVLALGVGGNVQLSCELRLCFVLVDFEELRVVELFFQEEIEETVVYGEVH